MIKLAYFAFLHETKYVLISRKSQRQQSRSYGRTIVQND